MARKVKHSPQRHRDTEMDLNTITERIIGAAIEGRHTSENSMIFFTAPCSLDARTTTRLCGGW